MSGTRGGDHRKRRYRCKALAGVAVLLAVLAVLALPAIVTEDPAGQAIAVEPGEEPAVALPVTAVGGTLALTLTLGAPLLLILRGERRARSGPVRE